jgi:hypothetical protein
MWDHEMLYCDTSSKDEQLLTRSVLWNPKNRNVEVGWKLQFIFCFMEITHKPLHLEKWSLVQKTIMDTPMSFISIIILCNKVCKYGYGANFWGYVEKNAKPLCVEFCNFVQCFSLWWHYS